MAGLELGENIYIPEGRQALKLIFPPLSSLI
jgi:hypothetical protein